MLTPAEELQAATDRAVAVLHGHSWDGCPNCRALRERVRALEKRLGIQHQLHGIHVVSVAFGMWPAAARVLLQLHSAYPAPLRSIDLWSTCLTHDSNPESVKAVVYHVRKAMGPAAVITHHGRGYSLSADAKHRVDDVLARSAG